MEPKPPPPPMPPPPRRPPGPPGPPGPRGRSGWAGCAGAAWPKTEGANAGRFAAFLGGAPAGALLGHGEAQATMPSLALMQKISLFPARAYIIPFLSAGLLKLTDLSALF